MNRLSYEQILEATNVGESTDIEFKSAKGGFPKSFWQTYSAMANTDGGTIVFGASEKGHKVKLDGLTRTQVRKYTKELWDSLNNRTVTNRNLLSNEDVVDVRVQNGYLLCVSIPPASRIQRPVHTGLAPYRNTFRRNYEGDYRCSDDEVRRMFADSNPKHTPDMRILDCFSISDLDARTLVQYRQRFRAAKGDHPWLSLNDKELLEKIGGWRRDRTGPGEGVTLAGLLMFGKGEAITDPDAIPGYFVDYREKLDSEQRWTDRISPDGTWEPNLFQFFQRVWPRLATALPVPFQLKNGMRRDETPAHEALREAFVNALIHADYDAVGGIIVERSVEEFVFDNPGMLLVSLEQYYRGGISECRNKSLQKMFLMIGGGERAGSGSDKIRSGWQSRSWRTPNLVPTNHPDRVRLTMSMVSLIPKNTLAFLYGHFGQSRIAHLSAGELQALATAHIEGGVSNVRLQELVSDHPVDITRMLQKLRSQGYLRSNNRKRWTSYELATTPVQQSLFRQSEKHDNETGSESSGGPASGSIHFDYTVPGGKEGSIHSERGSIQTDPNSIHSEETEIRKIIVGVKGKKRVPKHVMRSVISNLCTERYLSLAQLSTILERNPTALRNHYISPMVKERKLVLRYPDVPNRPDQAYTAWKQKGH